MTIPALGRPGFYPAGAAAWLPLSLAWSVGVAALAVLIQPYFAPMIVFPLLVGIVWGAGLAGGLRVCNLAHRPSIVFGAIVAGGLLVYAQHEMAFRLAVQEIQRRQEQMPAQLRALPDLMRKAQAVPPESLGEYLADEARQGRSLFGHVVRGPAVWASWALDAALAWLAGGVVLAIALRRPYCSRCHSWYRTTRAGRVTPATVLGWAPWCTLPPLGEQEIVEYRIRQCATGCGPTQLELSWESGGGGTVRVWLEIEQRNQVVGSLDRPPH